ncbi:hypothetical protein R6242_15370 [Iodobacter sp. CM08]|uniref:hypothetical protein n=1 Tax=Iodobacter sp. CM08 TaxID=3085902 RepID=UPI0029824D52|nr:hypothetical protein [Iodobacter sp. CM08]MDW5417946.1 hypothetical protein [Iodobacter sp. CM08]
MKYLVTALMMVVSTSFSVAATAPDMAALVTYETRVVTAEGVTKSTQFQETWLRTANRVWSERLVPKNAQAEANKGMQPSAKGHEGHNHDMNFALAAKSIERTANGEVKLNLVRMKMQQIIAMGTTDFREIGFDGSWDNAVYMIDRQQLKQMKKRSTPAPAGEVWLENRKNGMYTMVLWSEKLQLPKVIETGHENGGSWSRVTIEAKPMPKEMPWISTAGFRQRDYMDLLD